MPSSSIFTLSEAVYNNNPPSYREAIKHVHNDGVLPTYATVVSTSEHGFDFTVRCAFRAFLDTGNCNSNLAVNNMRTLV